MGRKGLQIRGSFHDWFEFISFATILVGSIRVKGLKIFGLDIQLSLSICTDLPSPIFYLETALITSLPESMFVHTQEELLAKS